MWGMVSVVWGMEIMELVQLRVVCPYCEKSFMAHTMYGNLYTRENGEKQKHFAICIRCYKSFEIAKEV